MPPLRQSGALSASHPVSSMGCGDRLHGAWQLCVCRGQLSAWEGYSSSHEHCFATQTVTPPLACLLTARVRALSLLTLLPPYLLVSAIKVFMNDGDTDADFILEVRRVHGCLCLKGEGGAP